MDNVKKIKILHVITSLEVGGAEKLLVDMLPSISKLGNDVELLLFNGKRTFFYDQLIASGIKVHYLSHSAYSVINLVKLIKYINKYDIIHTHNTPCQYYVAIIKLLTNAKSILVTTEHSTNNRRRYLTLFKYIDKLIYGQYKKIICISDQAKINLINYIEKISNKVLIIYNGVNISKFENVISKAPAICNTITVSMVAGFRVQKDQDTLIMAMSLLPDNFILNLVGDGVRREILQAIVSKYGLINRVNFLGIRSDVPEILRNSDIIVLSSHYEGLSLSCIEGMSSGKPFIASDVDGLHEVVKDSGILFKEGNYVQLASIIKAIIEDSQYYVSIAKTCQAKAKEYDISITANKYNELYKELVYSKLNGNVQ